MTDESIKRSRLRAESFYETWSDRFLAQFGTTLQAGLVKRSPDDAEDHEVSAQLLAERAGLCDGDTVLDAGSGFGGPATAIALRLPACQITGVTISRTQAEMATALAEVEGVDDRVCTVRGDYHELPFSTSSFDVALYLESIGYSDDHDVLFDEACRTVRHGGTIYIKDVFARTGGLTGEQRADLAHFDEIWQLAASPTLQGVTTALTELGCEVVHSGELANVGTAAFMAALIEPDPDALFRLNDLGERFAVRSADMPLFFGEVLARVP